MTNEEILGQAYRGTSLNPVADYHKRAAIKAMSAARADEQERVLSDFIFEIKREFSDQNWDYLEFIADRVKSKTATP